MAGPNSCSPCDCIPSNMSDEYFKPAVMAALCSIVTGESVGSQTEGIDDVTAGTLPLTTTGVQIVAVQTVPIKILTAFNTTDADILISIDGGVTYQIPVPGNKGTAVIDFAANGKSTVGPFFAKTTTGSTTSGNLYLGLIA